MSEPSQPDSPTSYLKSHHVLIFIVVITFLLVFHFRHKIIALHDRYRTSNRIRRGHYTNLGSFEDDIANGLTSDNFDLEANNSNDTRKGLSEDAKLKIKEIMVNKGLSFDEARAEYTRNTLKKNNIDENGVPRDPKLVTF
ncbi:hypothetical protein SBY92_002872 [Candida maltosa Xu316]|uniref:Uncharacterized protein n=1 Tax=Candida maltosa (strain Xu316) TaxID=1245528 RepID=M3JY94_CANMX|nr:hypothetical protein G210_2278 [Candida maltosa Xu316]